MKSKTVLDLTQIVPLSLLAVIGIGTYLASTSSGPELAGYEAILSSREREVVGLDESQLNSIAPMAISGALVMLPGSGFDLREDRGGHMVENYALACLVLQPGQAAARLVRFRSGEVISVSEGRLDRRIMEDRPCDLFPEIRTLSAPA